MNEIPYRKVGWDREKDEPIFRREMTAEEVRERADLNVANTAEAIRHRILEEAAKVNGRS